MERISTQEGAQQEARQGFKCPTCEKSISIQVRGVKDLPQNLHLDAETKVAQYQSKIVGSREVPCDACNDNSSGPAVGFCCTCLQFLCQFCCDYHKRARNFRPHSVLPLGEKVDRELLSAIKPSCSSHSKEFIIYCETCSSLICQDCITSDHRDHTHDARLPNIARSHQDKIRKLLTSAQKAMEKLTGAIDDNNKALERVEVCEETVSQTIRETFEELHQTLEDRMNELLRELHDDSLSKKTALGLQKENFEALKQTLSHCTGIASSVLTYTDYEIVALKQVPSTELQASIKRVQKTSLIPCENSDIKTASQLDLYRKYVFEVFSLFDSVCPEKSDWKLSASSPFIDTSFSIVVVAKDYKERLYQCNDIKVMAELTPAPPESLLFPQAAVPPQFAPLKVIRLKAPQSEFPFGYLQAVPIVGQASGNCNGAYTITFFPSTAASGRYDLSVRTNGQHIKDSPKSVSVEFVKK